MRVRKSSRPIVEISTPSTLCRGKILIVGRERDSRTNMIRPSAGSTIRSSEWAKVDFPVNKFV